MAKDKVIYGPVENLSEEEFRLRRMDAIGSSDMQHLKDMAPYGCRRFLEIEKSKLFDLEDREGMGNALARGKFYEGVVAMLYASLWAVDPKVIGPAHFESRPFLRGNADRIVYVAGKKRLLEIKTMNSFVYKKMLKDGPSDGYIVQTKFLSHLYECEEGELFCYCPDLHEWKSFVFDAKDFDQSLLEEAAKTWKLIEALRKMQPEEALELLSPKKDIYYKGCMNCPANQLCHDTGDLAGLGMIEFPPHMREKLVEFLELKPDAKELADHVDELKDEIEEFILANKANTGFFDKHEVVISPRSRTTVKSEVKEILTEAQKAKYMSESKFNVLLFKEKKEPKVKKAKK